MLKFIKHHLTNISHVEIYPIISFLIFFVFFAAVIYWVIRSSKEEMDKLANIPFDKK